jgi:hypothetical protein
VLTSKWSIFLVYEVREIIAVYGNLTYSKSGGYEMTLIELAGLVCPANLAGRHVPIIMKEQGKP